MINHRLDHSLERFGHHLIMGVLGTALSDDEKRLLNAVKPAGILFLARNFPEGVTYPLWLERFGTLIQQIRQYTERDRLFLTIDHEGGRVVRTPAPITRFPPAILYGLNARLVARATAQELKSMGLNVSWAPVTDVHSHPDNPIIGARAFGTTVSQVQTYALDYYLGLKDEQVLGCAKHFPGHGRTLVDSHLALPTLNTSAVEMNAVEIPAFAPLINHQVPFVMTAHVCYPQLDATHPATLSSPILQGILRQQLGYQGVVVSDDLDMGAVSALFEQPETLTQAFRAGCDMLIISRFSFPQVPRIQALAQGFASAVSQQKIPESQLAASRSRIDALLAMTPQPPLQTLAETTFKVHAALACDVAIGQP